jgi:hypothetical protein
VRGRVRIRGPIRPRLEDARALLEVVLESVGVEVRFGAAGGLHGQYVSHWRCSRGDQGAQGRREERKKGKGREEPTGHPNSFSRPRSLPRSLPFPGSLRFTPPASPLDPHTPFPCPLLALGDAGGGLTAPPLPRRTRLGAGHGEGDGEPPDEDDEDDEGSGDSRRAVYSACASSVWEPASQRGWNGLASGAANRALAVAAR